jgi:hypothetical protein
MWCLSKSVPVAFAWFALFRDDRAQSVCRDLLFVSNYVRQQVHQLDLIQSESYAMHAHLLPSYYLERVASTKTILEGQPLRDLADRI